MFLFWKKVIFFKFWFILGKQNCFNILFSLSTSISTTDPVTSASPDVLAKRGVILSAIDKVIFNPIGDFANTLPSQVNNETLNQFIKTPDSINGVSFIVSIDDEAIKSSSDKQGVLVIRVSGTLDGV
ncbi:lipoprotein 17-related variable surface protein [[Mycoplasma] mobile]|uniref:lipoprotein 17-related variable surface protein n=1 Tax=[Mycoplasma] mobile TaxID=2118 RepID=UPI0002D6EBED|nr:lipoprotein 17-related variable surface protein [[Mycoplasma] mobile]